MFARRRADSGDTDEDEAAHLQVVVITVALVGGRLDVEVVPEVHPDKVVIFSLALVSTC